MKNKRKEKKERNERTKRKRKNWFVRKEKKGKKAAI